MSEIGYKLSKTDEYVLPNAKRFITLDFSKE